MTRQGDGGVANRTVAVDLMVVQVQVVMKLIRSSRSSAWGSPTTRRVPPNLWIRFERSELMTFECLLSPTIGSKDSGVDRFTSAKHIVSRLH